MKPQKNNIESELKTLEALLAKITESALEMGRLIVKLIGENQDNYNQIKQRLNLSDCNMERLQKIGLGQMNPQLAIDNSPAAEFIERLPRAQQDRIIESGAIVVRSVDGGKIQSEQVPYQKMTYREAAAVFSGGEVHSLEQQAQSIAAKVVRLAPKPTYEIDGNTVIFHEGARFTAAQLEALAARVAKCEMETLETSMKRAQVANS